MEEPKSIFIETFGDYPALRMIDFLLESRDLDYPITEIAKFSGVHFLTFKKIWPGFVKRGWVVKTRTMGNATLYKLNKEDPIIKKLIEVDNFLCHQAALEACKKKVTAKARVK